MRSRWSGFRSSLAGALDGYLARKRAIGLRFDSSEKNLRLLDAFLVRRRIGSAQAVTPDLINAFLESRRRTSTRSHNGLLGTTRQFFEWLVLRGDLRESPVRVTPRRGGAQRIPFLLQPKEQRQLLALAGRLRDTSNAPRRAQVYRTALAIMSVLGLRVREVSRLRRGDVDLDQGVLLIRETKFGKSRLVPFGRRMAQLLRRYLDVGESGGVSVATADTPLFTFRLGKPIHPETISHTFHTLALQLGLRPRGGAALPRAHDLRHAFAVRTLLRWYRSGVNPEARLLQLSTFLGHSNPVHTAVYLTITDELLDEAGRRFERYGSPLCNETR